jgi:hypothetical protein
VIARDLHDDIVASQMASALAAAKALATRELEPLLGPRLCLG